MPIFLVDVEGTLLFYNEPAEVLLGLRYDETGEMAKQECGTVFVPIDADGEPLAAEQLPLAIALRERRPAHGRFFMTALDGVTHDLLVTAFPLVGQHERALAHGPAALFCHLCKSLTRRSRSGFGIAVFGSAEKTSALPAVTTTNFGSFASMALNSCTAFVASSRNWMSIRVPSGAVISR